MRKRYSAKQKAQIVLEVLKEERPVTQIASEYGVHPNQLHRWKKQALDHFAELFVTDDKQQRALDEAQQRKLDELYAEIGKLTTQLNWLKKKSGLELFEE